MKYKINESQHNSKIFSSMKLATILFFTFSLILLHQIKAAPISPATLPPPPIQMWNNILALNNGYGLQSSQSKRFKTPLPQNNPFFTLHALWPYVMPPPSQRTKLIASAKSTYCYDSSLTICLDSRNWKGGKGKERKGDKVSYLDKCVGGGRGRWNSTFPSFSSPSSSSIPPLHFSSNILSKQTITAAEIQSVRGDLSSKWSDLCDFGNATADLEFWGKERKKHGTCSKFTKLLYFQKTLALFDLLGLPLIVKTGGEDHQLYHENAIL